MRARLLSLVAASGSLVSLASLVSLVALAACSASSDGAVEASTTRLTATTPADGDYVLHAVNSGKCLDVAGASLDNGAAVQQWSCNGTGAQVFRIHGLGDGTFTLQNPSSGKYVSIEYASPEAGKALLQWDYQNIDTQKFRALAVDGGAVTLRVKLTDFAVDVRASSTADGAVVQQWPWNGTTAQEWQLVAVGSATPAPPPATTTTPPPPSTPPPASTTPPAGTSAVYAHYMPWFASKPVSGAWGWHWTMNARNPDTIVNGQRDIASKGHPQIGPYDSGDADLAEYHALLMKYAGIRGAFADWYGIDSYLDYAVVHRNTGVLFDALKRAGLSMALCFEDQAIKHAADAGAAPEGVIERGRRTMRALRDGWFNDASYVHVGAQPLLLNFGPQLYSSSDWDQVFADLPTKPSFYTLHKTVAPAVGYFYWPIPQLGVQGDRDTLLRLLQTKPMIPAAYPRFDDYYAQAGVGASYGSIPDRDGANYAETLGLAYSVKPAYIQLATWNDWGEGTNIEPSVEYGFRDLEKTQELVKANGWPGFPYTADDLRLPIRLYNARKGGLAAATANAIATELNAGRPANARTMLTAAGR